MMLALENIGAAYGMSQVLNGIALTVGAGEAVALLGRNGVGKTTLLRTIVGLHPANTGSIAFDADNVVKMPAFRRARLGIGYVPQGRGIFPQLTVAENLSVGASALDGRKPAVAPDPAPLYELFPALTKLRDRKGGVLSGGEQQQLALARALLGKPKLLLLAAAQHAALPVAQFRQRRKQIVERRGVRGERGFASLERRRADREILGDR